MKQDRVGLCTGVRNRGRISTKDLHSISRHSRTSKKYNSEGKRVFEFTLVPPPHHHMDSQTAEEDKEAVRRLASLAVPGWELALAQAALEYTDHCQAS